MAAQMTFKRYELKYLLSPAQKQAVLRGIEPFMELDRYGRTTIRSIYCDTENFRLVRRSVGKPAYKEKLRLRSYQQAQPGQPVFVELKKKYRDVVYKRRLALAEGLVAASFARNLPLPAEGQIAAEIEYFRQYYGPLRPAVFLSYEREAYYALDGGDLRITFDENILFRCRDLSLCAPVFGSPILPGELTLMEIKTPGGLPLSLAHLLAREKIFKTSFSKYGEAYRQILHGNTQGGLCYA